MIMSVKLEVNNFMYQKIFSFKTEMKTPNLFHRKAGFK